MLEQILLGIIGISAGMGVAAGVFAFVVELGIVSDFADRTHTGEYISVYETGIVFGGSVGNMMYVYHSFTSWPLLLPVFGLFSGIFVGCWAMALAEILNIFPIIMRKVKLLQYSSFFLVSMALGKGIGAWIFFVKGW